ncbi:MAG TPA: neutral zinc metallopeptidase, partial [Candidatus Limnocylindria bacterium]|nr:neutral zinc metallopeptidase [Candidatus Limnocylindria bacterium]
MTFRRDAPLDPSQVEDRRGAGGLLVGGGGIGIVILIASLLLGVDPTAMLEAIPTDTAVQNGPTATECKTGSQANERDDCRIVGFVDSVQKYWSDQFARTGKQYAPAKTVLFSGYAQSACGTAQTAMGPFYCPEDGKVYMDTTFFQDLRTKLGAQAGPFAQGYVVAHEYGHHVQHLIGGLNNSTRTGAESQSVRTELQADCYAGVWAKNASETGYLETPTQAEIADALDAAAAVGDDRIQQKTQGRVDPESFTHGTSAQRVE